MAMSAPPDVRVHRDADGRAFHHVLRVHPGARSLVAHFSAFFGEWGNARPYRTNYQGYFHRLRMLADVDRHHWLFLCDEYGAEHNGTYYTGERGNDFVARATQAIVVGALDEVGLTADRLVTMGSSMGATGALDVGLDLGVAGIVAISPHIDLDIAAAMCGRDRHVAAICPDGNPLSSTNHVVTRRIRRRLESWTPERPLPRLFVQSCCDDVGVHKEQVLPLIETWRKLGGRVDHDARPKGGHTSDWATRELLLDTTDRILAHEPIDLTLYQTAPPYLGTRTTPPLSHRLRRAASLTRKRLLRGGQREKSTVGRR
ncbi:MAG: Two component regulator three Y domain-containing protein [Chloroflexi bacterium]|nr:MAG: Two component regulator three Y domain-containing protein [Chloroflexota bacterium]